MLSISDFYDNLYALALILQYGLDNETDIYAYVGNIEREGYEQVCKLLNKERRKNCLIILCTFGGDPNAGYRIARSFSHNYPHGKISVLAPDYCKSAGTLICIGAHELVIADRGELGPLDIQVQKQDEIFQRSSGLDIIRGLTYLYDGVLNTFGTYLFDINRRSGLSTKAASEIASKLTIGIHEPIFAQIDPLRLGEMQAALTIAQDYGRRLDERSGNLKPNALQMLTSGYPSHGFVIDRKEARQLFNNVRSPNDIEKLISDWVSDIFSKPHQSSVLVLDLISLFSKQIETTENLKNNQQLEEPTEDKYENFAPEYFESEHDISNISDFDNSSGDNESSDQSVDGGHQEYSEAGA